MLYHLQSKYLGLKGWRLRGMYNCTCSCKYKEFIFGIGPCDSQPPPPPSIKGFCRSMAPALVTTLILIQTHFSDQQIVYLTTYFISITFFCYINHYRVVNYSRLEHWQHQYKVIKHYKWISKQQYNTDIQYDHTMHDLTEVNLGTAFPNLNFTEWKTTITSKCWLTCIFPWQHPNSIFFKS